MNRKVLGHPGQEYDMAKKQNWVSRMKSKVQRRFRAEARIKKEVASKKAYAKHYKKAGPKHAFTYAQWLKKGEEPVYFKGVRKKSAEARLREARIKR